MKSLLPGIALLSVLVGFPSPARADVITGWNDTAGRAARACNANPLHESRMYAMAHLAIHDALNAIDHRFRPYAFDSDAAAGASVEAAVAAAARHALVVLLGQISPACGATGVPIVEADYTTAMTAIVDGPAKTDGVAVGQAAAAAILDLRADDGSDTVLLVDPAYPQGTNPGEWRFTPGTAFAFAPGWAAVTPFALRDPSQFRASRPYPLTTKKYADDLNEVKSLGGVTSARTADQTQIAHFWVESSPLRWNRIARTVVAAAGLDLWENARLFALLNVALADGYIGSWDSKYRYNFWRPVTAIHLADTDGNPNTVADPTWASLRTTPPIPDHDSAHAVEGAAAAEVLKSVLGTDSVAFSVCSFSMLVAAEQCGGASEVLRSYASFSHAADENGVSRILVGFHFRKAVEDGIRHGRKIGLYAVIQLLRPAH